MDLIVSEATNHYPNLELAQKLYQYEMQLKEGLNSTDLKENILVDIKEACMSPLYTRLCEKYSWMVDSDLVESMNASNALELAKIQKQKDDAVQLAGDIEILDALFAHARFNAKIGNWQDALASFDEILGKPKTSSGKKIDAVMEKTRIFMFTLELPRLRESIVEAKKLIDIGGDWDRRNRLKVYEALEFLLLRDFKKASKLLVDCIATFTCTELCTYEQFMFYAVIIGVVSLSRTELYKQFVNNPQVLAVIRDLPKLQTFLNSIYQCEYGQFIKSLLELYPEISNDRYLGPHSSYLVRELRVLAYSQFLEAYRSVRMSSMATAFGISDVLLDKELSRFISAGRLHAKIDKVGDVVETSRPDVKNIQYQDTIKQGDVLLNQIQRLVRVIDV